MPDNQSSIAIQISFSALPEGWKGTPDLFLQWISEHAQFKATGAFLTGSNGGAEPMTDQGLWVDGIHLNVWTGARYEPIFTVPVGTILDWCGAGPDAPKDYVFCDGTTLVINEYPELYAVIGRTYSDNGADGDPDTQFRLPNFAGRVAVGSGIGDYNPTIKVGGLTGKMEERTVGQYFGQEWPTSKVIPAPGAPTSTRTLMTLKGGTDANGFNNPYKYFHSVFQPSVVVRKIIRTNRRVGTTP